MHKTVDFQNGRLVYAGSRLQLRLVPVPAEGGEIQKEVIVHPGAVVVLPFA